MIKLLIAALAGLIFNLVRGGFHGPLRAKILQGMGSSSGPRGMAIKIVNRLLDGKVINALAFGIFCVIAHASEYQGIIEGMPTYIFVSGALSLFLYESAMMLRGSAPGWGDYIGAIGGWRKGLPVPEGRITKEEYEIHKPLQEVDYIDRIIKPLEKHPVLWGLAGLSIRCGEWGLFIGAPLLSFWPVLAGLLAGPLCWAAIKIGPRRYGWMIFEALLGVVFWASVIL